MKPPGSAQAKGPRLVALFLIGTVLFNYPMLALFDRVSTAFGIPVLYMYIFSAWSLLIACMAYVVESKG